MYFIEHCASNNLNSKISKAQELEQKINTAFIPVKFHYSKLTGYGNM
jgi:hypothetical protein